MDFNKDYYAELEIDKKTSAEEIKKKYRKLALKYHPDRNGGDKSAEEKFQKISEAYDILTNKRDMYDQRSPHGAAYNPMMGGFGSFGGFTSSSGGVDLGDMINNFFNGFGFRDEFAENLDLGLNWKINLRQIYLNEKIIIKYNRNVHCGDCNGTGFDQNSEATLCDVCNGSGVHNNTTCKYCLGSGKIYAKQCDTCKGEKVLSKENEVNMQNTGNLRNTIRNAHPGLGHQSKYYRNKIGKLVLQIIVEQDENYTITNNYDLNRTINVHYEDAINGYNIEITHIDGTTIKIKLDEHTKDGDILTIKEKGLLYANGKRANLFLKVNIIIDYDKIKK